MDYRYLKNRGFLNEAEAAEAPAPQRHAPLPETIPREVLALVPAAVAWQHSVVPVAADANAVTLAAANPDDLALADRLSTRLARRVRLVGAPAHQIRAALARHYGREKKRGARTTPQTLSFLGGDEFEDLDDGSEVFALDQDTTPSGGPLYPPPPPPAAADRAPTLAAGSPHSAARRSRAVGSGGGERGQDRTTPLGGSGVWTYVVEEGQQVLVRRPNGTMDVIAGPKRVWKGRNVFRPMQHFVAHPGDYLIVRFRDGQQEHLPGPAELWFDPRVHHEVKIEEGLQIAAKEAVVVYSNKEGTAAVQRRIVYGPALFVPRPGEWLHTFSWHASKGGSNGVVKIPNGLVFQKLWMMPDQMYHDVGDVRTADDAVLTIRLMIFFELLDIERMLEATHDPIGDFVNAASSDVVDFTGRHDFESFKRNTDKLNELETYRQLVGRAAQCGYRINKVVYRGYGAPERLQQMHDQAIEARTRLQLERATEQQAQQLENDRLDSQLSRSGKRRGEQSAEVAHELEMARKRQEVEMEGRAGLAAFRREQARADAEMRLETTARRQARRREHLEALRAMGVDLTAYLTQGRADRVVEVRGTNGATHVHLDPSRDDHRSPARGGPHTEEEVG